MAGGITPTRPGGIIEGINVTPLVDIMLVLLVIFIVTAKILVTPAVPLDLPQASKTEEIQVVFAVSIPSDGTALVNGQAVANNEALVAMAAAAVAKDKDVRATIQAASAVSHGRVIGILDTLRRAGLTKVAFATRPADQAQP